MKYLIPLIFILVGYMPVQAQAQEVSREWMTKKIEHVRPGLYKVEYSRTPYTSMKGYISVHREKMIREGVWTVYRHGYPVQRIKYSNGNRIWIELENGRRYTQQQMEIQQLKLKVIELEKQLADVKDL